MPSSLKRSPKAQLLNLRTVSSYGGHMIECKGSWKNLWAVKVFWMHDPKLVPNQTHNEPEVCLAARAWAAPHASTAAWALNTMRTHETDAHASHCGCCCSMPCQCRLPETLQLKFKTMLRYELQCLSWICNTFCMEHFIDMVTCRKGRPLVLSCNHSPAWKCQVSARLD